MSHTLTITDAKFEVKCAGETLLVDVAKMDQSYLDAIMRKGVQRYWNDQLAGLEPNVKLEQYREELAIAHSGKALEKPVRGTGGGSTVDPVAKRAMTEAKAELMIRFARANKLDATKMHKIAALAVVPVVAAYFTEKDTKFTWIDAKVREFMERELANGGRDYMQEAQDFFAEPESETTLEELGL
jgi:hypothetical protein